MIIFRCSQNVKYDPREMINIDDLEWPAQIWAIFKLFALSMNF